MPLLGVSPGRLVPLCRTLAMLVTACTAGAYRLFFFAGVSLAGVALGTIVAVGSAPLFAGLVGWAVLRHRPTFGWLGATLVCLVGLGLLTARACRREVRSASCSRSGLPRPESRLPAPPSLTLHVPAPPASRPPAFRPRICSHSTDLLPSGWEQIGQVGADPGAEWWAAWAAAAGAVAAAWGGLGSGHLIGLPTWSR